MIDLDPEAVEIAFDVLAQWASAATLAPDDVLIKTHACGVCYHDIINRRGNLPRTKVPSILGHEIAGVVPTLREFRTEYGLDMGRARRLPDEAIIMHPGPMNRGVEIDSAVADGPQSVILPQVTNGVAVRMAVLYLLAGGAPERAEEAKKGEA